MQIKKVTCSHTMTEALKKDLQQFAKFAYKTESEVLIEALEQYLGSKKAFQQLRKAEAEKQEFYRQLSEDADFRNLVVPKSQLCKGR